MAASIRNLIGLAVVMVSAIIVLIGLGIWQLERLNAKSVLLDRITERLDARPAPLPLEAFWPRLTIDEHDYLKISLSGTFLHEQESYLFGVIDKNERGDNEPGFFVMTPLLLDDGTTVIVNRGFVRQDLKDPARRQNGQIAGRVTVTGLLRLPERKTIFTPEPDPLKRVLYARDPALIAAWLTRPRVAPFIIDADATANPGGWPQGGQTIVAVANNHLQYAITWFALAIVISAMLAFYLGPHLRGRIV